MAVDNLNLATLIGSRICHDLISPVGAINNGLELLGMSGAMDGPELELISDSVGNANARIRFFRIAFGAAGDQGLGRAEVVSVLEDVSKGGRLKYQWFPEDTVARNEVRLLFLAALCLESALPFGGMVQIQRAGSAWQLSGTGTRIALDGDLWAYLKGDDQGAKITPALVQFALLPALAQEMDRKIEFSQTDDEIKITL